MSKNVNIDWSKLSFDYIKTDYDIFQLGKMVNGMKET